MPRSTTPADRDAAIDAIWGELRYQEILPRRTDDEAKDVAGFLTLIRRYVRKAEDAWADNPGRPSPDGIVVEEALHEIRKIAAIAARAMIYCGVRYRSTEDFRKANEEAGR